MQKKHIIIAAIAFLMCAISAYFGARIHNASENFLLAELNEFDQIYHDDVKVIPAISFLAALVTLGFLLAIITLQLIVTIKASRRQVKNIGIGLLFTGAIILIVDIMTLLDPSQFDFSKWGFVWICLGIFFIAGNILSAAIYRFGK